MRGDDRERRKPRGGRGVNYSDEGAGGRQKGSGAERGSGAVGGLGKEGGRGKATRALGVLGARRCLSCSDPLTGVARCSSTEVAWADGLGGGPMRWEGWRQASLVRKASARAAFRVAVQRRSQ